MDGMVRIGIIGVGTMGHAHARYLADGNVENAALSALCDVDEARRNELKGLFPQTPVFADAEELFAAKVCDAVIIATPHYAHPEIGIRAFENGLHVLSEKPMAVQVSRAQAFVEASKLHNRCFAVMYNQRTNPLFQKARALVKDGTIGELKRLTWIITNWYRTQNYYDSGSWRATWDGEGGGVLMNQAPHNLDLMQWIFGMPASVRGFCSVGKYHHIEVEDDAMLYAEYSNGATALFQTTTGEYPGTNRLEITGDRGKMVLENGMLKLWRLKEPERKVCFESDRASAKIPMEYEEITIPSVKNAHGTVVQNFVDHIIGGVSLICPGEEALNEVILSNAAYLSSWTDSCIKLPLDPAAFDERLAVLRAESATHSKNGQYENSSYKERWQVRW